MPIKGLTGRGATFAQIGEIRKGAKKPTTGNKPGADLTYFRIVFEEGEPPETAQKCEALFGKEPRELRIMLPLNQVESVWSAWIDAYTAGGLIYRSNGNDARGIAAGDMGGLGVIFWRDPMTGATLVRNGLALKDLTLPDETEIKAGDPVPCIAKMGYPVGKYETAGGDVRDLMARPDARLMVILQGLGRFAYLVFKTTSQHDIANLDAQLEGLVAIQRAATAAGLSGVPLIMRRRPKMVSTPIKKGNVIKRQRMEKWLVSLETDPDWAGVKMQAMIEAATPEILEGDFVETAGLLPEPDDGNPESPEWSDEADRLEAERLANEAAANEQAELQEAQEVVRRHSRKATTAPGSKPTAAAKRSTRHERTFDKDLLDSLIKEGLAGTIIEAATMLGRSPWQDVGVPMRRSHVIVWSRAFKQAVAEGLPQDAAADAATAELAELGGG